MNRQSDTFKRHSEAVLASIKAGASVTDAATHVGISPRTVERWLQRGRLEPTGIYGPFSLAVELIRERQSIGHGRGQSPGSRERQTIAPDNPLDTSDLTELTELIDAAARSGSVPAMRLRWQMFRAEDEGSDLPHDPLTDLERRRLMTDKPGGASTGANLTNQRTGGTGP